MQKIRVSKRGSHLEKALKRQLQFDQQVILGHGIVLQRQLIAETKGLTWIDLDLQASWEAAQQPSDACPQAILARDCLTVGQ